MKKKNIVIIVLSIVILVTLFFCYKGFMYYRYSFERPSDFEDVAKGLKNQKTMTIKKNYLSDDEYIAIGNYKIKNILDGYQEDETSSVHVKVYKKEVDDKQYFFQFTLDLNNFQIVDAFLNDVTVYGEENWGFLKGSIMDADRKGFLEKNNIKNDIDFYKFVADNYFIESNIFTDTKTLKQNYAFNLITTIAVPKIDEWTVLDGDITGYIMKIGTKDDLTILQISIIDNDKVYHITTTDSRFRNDTFLADFVSSIEILK